MDNIKKDFTELINYCLKSTIFSEEMQIKFNKISSYTDQNIYAILDLWTCKNNDNYYSAETLIIKIIEENTYTKESIFSFLSDKKEELSKNIYLAIWKKLFNDEKIEYLNVKKALDNIDIFLINKSLENSNTIFNNNFFNQLINSKSVLEKIPNGSLYFYLNSESIRNFDINNLDLCLKLTDQTIGLILQQKISSFEEFGNYIVNNEEIIQCLPLSSMAFKINNLQLFKLLFNKYPDFIKIFKPDFIKKFLKKDEIELIIENCQKNTIYQIAEYYKDIFPFKFSLKEIKNIPDFSLNINPHYLFETISLEYLQKFTKPIICEFINNEFSDEEKVNILRNTDFINYMEGYYLEIIINNMPFISAFNMLQNKDIINKIDTFSCEIQTIDKNLIKGFLNYSGLVYKSDHEMLKTMLSIINKNDAKYFIEKAYVINNLTNGEIVNILSHHIIDINSLSNFEELITRLSTYDLENYFNQYWETDFKIDIVLNPRILSNLLDLSDEQIKALDFNEFKYLMETIEMKNYLAIQSEKINIESFKSVLLCYILFGLNKSLEIVNLGYKKLTINDLKEFIKTLVSNDINNYKNNNSPWIKDFSKKVINELNGLNSYTYNNGEKLIISNAFLKDVIKKMKESSYSSYENVINEFNLYLDSIHTNHFKYKNHLIDFCNNFITYLIEQEEIKLTTKYNNRFKEKLRIKEYVTFKKKQTYGKQFLNNLKLKLLVKSLQDKTNLYRYSYAYKEKYNALDLEKEIKQLLKVNDKDLKQIINCILVPLANNQFNIHNTLNLLNIKKPNNYELYTKYIEEIELVSKLNQLTFKLKLKYPEIKILEIMNYISYESPISFKISKKELKEYKRYAEKISDFSGEINVEKLTLKFSYTNFKEDFDITEISIYNKYIDEIEAIIKKIKFFTSHYMDEEEIKRHYTKTYNNYLNNIKIDYPISNRFYDIKKSTFNFNDFVNAFNFHSFKGATKLNSNIIEKILETNYLYFVGFGCQQDKFFGDLLLNLNSMIIEDNSKSIIDIINDYYQNNNEKDIITNYSFKKNLTDKEKNLIIDNFINYKKSIPFIKGKIDNISYITSLDVFIEDKKTDILNYCLINKNGSMVKIYLNNSYIGYLLTIRNGNTLFFHSISLPNNIDYQKIINTIADHYLKETKEKPEPIEIIATSFQLIQPNSNLLPLTKTTCKKIDNPLSNSYDDYILFVNKYTDGKSPKTDFGYYQNYLLKTTITINENSFKYYDPTAYYYKPRKSFKIYSKLITKKDLSIINFINYCCKYRKYDINALKNYNPININDYQKIYIGSDWIIFVTNDNKFSKEYLNELGKYEIDNILNTIS